MMRKIDEVISELEDRIEQQNAIIARSDFGPGEMIFKQRDKCIRQLMYLMELKELGLTFVDTSKIPDTI